MASDLKRQTIPKRPISKHRWSIGLTTAALMFLPGEKKISRADDTPKPNNAPKVIQVKDDAVQKEVQDIIGKIKTQFEIGTVKSTEKQIKMLIADLDSKDFEKRFNAENEIKAIGETAVPELEKALKVSLSLEMKRRIERNLHTIKMRVPTLANQFNKLGQMQSQAKAGVPILIEALEDRDGDVRSAAASALRDIGPVAEAAVPALIERFKDDKNPRVRSSAGWALGYIGGPKAKVALPLLIETLKEDKNDDIRWAAAIALDGIGPDENKIAPALIKALKDKFRYVRWTAAGALGKSGPNATEATVKALSDTLKDEQYDIVATAARSLGNIGPKAEMAVPALIEVSKNKRKDTIEDTQVRWPAVEALGKIGSKKTRPVLVATLKDTDYVIRITAALSLMKVDPKATEALPVFIGVLQDSNAYEWMFEKIILALADMGPAAKKALPALKEVRDFVPYVEASPDYIDQWKQLSKQAGEAIKSIQKELDSNPGKWRKESRREEPMWHKKNNEYRRTVLARGKEKAITRG